MNDPQNILEHRLKEKRKGVSSPDTTDPVIVVLVVVVLVAVREALNPRVVIIVLCGRPMYSNQATVIAMNLFLNTKSDHSDLRLTNDFKKNICQNKLKPFQLGSSRDRNRTLNNTLALFILATPLLKISSYSEFKSKSRSKSHLYQFYNFVFILTESLLVKISSKYFEVNQIKKKSNYLNLNQAAVSFLRPLEISNLMRT